MNETFNFILDNLIRSYIYYVPKSFYNDLQKTEYKDLLAYTDVNTVAFIDKDKNPTLNKSLFNNIDIITKSKLLQENTFLLLEAQSLLDLEQFGYLLKTYREHLDIHTHITDWMSNNIAKDIIHATDDLKNMFNIQSAHFKSHQEEIQKKFGAVESQLKGIELNNYFKEKFASPDFKHSLMTFFKRTDNLDNHTKKSRKKKKVIISDEEADAFLLESVFNVKMN